jgi:uncharacterized protein YbjT (DUF2867 family)
MAGIRTATDLRDRGAQERKMSDTVLVVGGTGKTGRRVAERLTARGVPVRIGSRSATPPFDWDDRATWGPALRGTTAAYVSYYPDVALPAAADQVRSFAAEAVKQGLKRLVLLSGRGEEGALLCEQAVREAGAEWTILRCTWFSQNFSEGFFRDQVVGGEVALPAGEVREPFVDADDIADVGVAALTSDRHSGQVYELTGPRLLTFAEAIGEIAAASGRDIRYREIPLEDYLAALAALQVPADVRWLVEYLFTEVFDGRNARLADGVQRALGRPPRDFADFARRAATAGAWAPEVAGYAQGITRGGTAGS